MSVAHERPVPAMKRSAAPLKLRIAPEGRRRHTPWLIAGVLVVAVCAFGFGQLYLRTTGLRPVLAIADNVAAGQVLQASDLRIVDAAADDGISLMPDCQPRYSRRAASLPRPDRWEPSHAGRRGLNVESCSGRVSRRDRLQARPVPTDALSRRSRDGRRHGKRSRRVAGCNGTARDGNGRRGRRTSGTCPGRSHRFDSSAVLRCGVSCEHSSCGRGRTRPAGAGLIGLLCDKSDRFRFCQGLPGRHDDGAGTCVRMADLAAPDRGRVGSRWRRSRDPLRAELRARRDQPCCSRSSHQWISHGDRALPAGAWGR